MFKKSTDIRQNEHSHSTARTMRTHPASAVLDAHPLRHPRRVPEDGTPVQTVVLVVRAVLEAPDDGVQRDARTTTCRERPGSARLQAPVSPALYGKITLNPHVAHMWPACVHMCPTCAAPISHVCPHVAKNFHM